MEKHCYYLGFIVWLSYLIIVPIIIYSRGLFIFNHVSKNNISTCINLSEVSCQNQTSNCSDQERLANLMGEIDNRSTMCPPEEQRVILLLFDDFSLDCENEKPFSMEDTYCMIPMISEILTTYPNSSRFYKIEPDDTNNILDRIKTLTTGDMPNLMDATSNFFTGELLEDNIISQLLRQNRSTVLISTEHLWRDMFPCKFLRKHIFPVGRDVFDNEDVPLLLEKEILEDDWSFLIVHFSDSGNKVQHSKYQKFINFGTTVMKTVTGNMDNSTVLVTLGFPEKALPKAFQLMFRSQISLFIHSRNPLANLLVSSRPISQLDIVPTLSAILGIPIPFNNLGTIIIDALPAYADSNVNFLLNNIWSVIQRTLDYLDQSYEVDDMFKQNLSTDRVSISLEIIGNASSNRSVDIMNLSDYLLWLEDIVYSMQHSASKLQLFFMVLGLVYLCATVVYSLFFIIPTSKNRYSEIFTDDFAGSCYGLTFCFILLTVVAYVIYYSFTNCLCYIRTLLVFITVGQILVMSFYSRKQHVCLSEVHKMNKTELVFFFFLLSYVTLPFSNSFIIEQSSILLYTLNSLILYITLGVSHKPGGEGALSGIQFKVLLLLFGFVALCLVRISSNFWTCRDYFEQSWCPDFSSYFSTVSPHWKARINWFNSSITIGLCIGVFRQWFYDCGTLRKLTLSTAFLNFIPIVIGILVGSFLELDRMFKNWDVDHASMVVNIFARIILGLIFMGIFILIIQPVSIHRKNVEEESYSGTDDWDANTVDLSQNEDEIQETFSPAPVFYGIETIYSSFYLAIGLYLSFLIILLSEQKNAPSIVIMIITAIMVLSINAIAVVKRAESINEMFDISNLTILAWVILANYFFYGTGHQTMVMRIVREAARIGNFNCNFLRTTWVLVNTYGSHILMSFLLPLLVILPFTAAAVLKSTIHPENTELLKNNQNGEFLMSKHSETLVESVFQVSYKYIILTGTRIFFVMISTAIQLKNHDMIWSIFAPLFLFETGGFFVSIAVVICADILLIRLDNEVKRLTTGHT